MPPDQQEQFSISKIVIGVAGLLVVVWGGYSYLQSQGFFKGSTTSSASVAGYSAVGQSADIKTVATADSASPAQTASQTNSAGTGAPGTGKNSVATTVAVAPASRPPTLPFQAPPFNGSAWIYDWGAASITNNGLVFGAGTSTTGGDLFLASSSAWTNYSVAANVDWQAGASFGIIARLFDGKDFVYCDFGDKTAAIVQRTNGVDTTIAQGATLNGGAGRTEGLGIEVYGNSVACTFNGSEVLGAAIAQNDPATGGIGLISWDATPGVSKISINNLSATALSLNLIVAPFPAPIVASPTVVATATSTASTSATAVATLNIPYSATNFTNDTNWERTWGAMATDTSNFMDIGSAAGTSGGTTVLQNTSNWINYRFATTVDWVKGETFMAIGRYADANDYVACNFVQDPNVPGAVTIELEKFVNGNEATLQTGEDTNFSHEGSSNIAIVLSLQGSQATCSFNNHAISNGGSSSYGVSPIPGGVGFSTWDPTLGNSQIIVKQVSVTTNY